MRWLCATSAAKSGSAMVGGPYDGNGTDPVVAAARREDDDRRCPWWGGQIVPALRSALNQCLRSPSCSCARPRRCSSNPRRPCPRSSPASSSSVVLQRPPPAPVASASGVRHAFRCRRAPKRPLSLREGHFTMTSSSYRGLSQSTVRSASFLVFAQRGGGGGTAAAAVLGLLRTPAHGRASFLLESSFATACWRWAVFLASLCDRFWTAPAAHNGSDCPTLSCAVRCERTPP